MDTQILHSIHEGPGPLDLGAHAAVAELVDARAFRSAVSLGTWRFDSSQPH